MTSIADDIRRTSEFLEHNEKANAFYAIARAIMAANAHALPVGDYADQARLSPAVAEVLKAGVTVPGTGNSPLFQPMQRAFAQSLRPQSAFDVMWPFSTHVPFATLALTIASAFAIGTVAEGNPKPLASLALSSNTMSPVKVAGLVAASQELLKFGDPSSVRLFNQQLRLAAIIACNVKFLGDLIALTTPIASSGNTAANVLTGLGALLAALDFGLNAHVFFVLSGAAAKGLLTKTLGGAGGGAMAFPNINLQSGGEILPGVAVIISNSLPANTALMVDAGALLMADDGISLDGSKNASLQMQSAPLPEDASSVLLNLWQRNMQALRAERTFAYSVGRPRALASLSGVNW